MVFDFDAFRANAVPADLDWLSSLKRCMVLVPHADDESLACAGLMVKLREQGCKFRIIVTTDGSRSHPNSIAYPPKRLADVREEEMRHAIRIMGLPEETLRFYRATDAAMPTQGTSGFDPLLKQLEEDLIDFNPELILVPYELDPHCDHRATWQLLMAALKSNKNKKPIVWEYLIWLYTLAIPTDIPALLDGELIEIDTLNYLDIKSNCIAAHRSQRGLVVADDPSGFVLEESMVARFLTGKEYFMQRAKHNSGHSLSKDYFENIYAAENDPWQFETSAYEQQKYQATLSALPQGHYSSALEIGCSIGVLTKLLAERCDHLIAMDLSELALKQAQERLHEVPTVEFILGGVPQDYPQGTYDLVVVSEVGYYLSFEDLDILKAKIYESMNQGATLILVHWTHFVTDYPLTGDQVHDFFKDGVLSPFFQDRTNDYRLDVYQKQA